MKFALTTEQADLQQMLARYLAERVPLGETAHAVGSSYDVGAWSAMVRDLGLQGVDVPEALGGVGLGPVELSLVMQLAGRELYGGPLLASTGLGLSLLLASDGRDAAADALTRDVATGRVVVPAVADDGGRWEASAIGASAQDVDGAWLLDGTKAGVLQADLADDLLVAARRAEGTIGLYVVASTDVRVTVEPSIDPTRSTCTVDLAGTRARAVLGDVSSLLEAAALRADLAIASESLGAASRVLDLAVSHVTTRHQFGRPVGSFQGVKHRLADVLVEVELATSAVYLAACHLADSNVAAARASIPMARVAADTALSLAASASVQVHGGIGFTWENASHLFVKRARANRELLGRPAARLDQVWENGRELARTS